MQACLLDHFQQRLRINPQHERENGDGQQHDATGVESQLWWLVGALVIGSAIGVYYYLRVMVTLYLVEPNLRRHDAPLKWEQRTGGVMLLAIAILAFVLGVYPQPLLEMVQQAGLQLIG